jgi:flagellin
MRINNNIMALNAHRQLAVNQTNASKSMERLSSGMKINRAGDDAAGLAISEKMRGQIRGLKQAQRNAQDGISLIQTAEGALNEIHAILQRMRELAVQSATDTNTEVDRGEIQKEIDQLASEITRIANNTEFNTQTLLNGGIQAGNLGELGFHIGANQGQFIELGIRAMDAHTLGVARDVTTTEGTVVGDNIGSVALGDTLGSAIVNDAKITFAYGAVPATVASGEIEVSSGNVLTITATSAQGIAGNMSVVIEKGTEETVKASFSGGILTISLGTTQANNTANAIQSAIRGLGTVEGVDFSNFDVAGTGGFESGGVAAPDSDITGALTGGVDAGNAITVSDGKTSEVFAVIDNTATTFTTTGTVFGGLTITLATGKTVADLTSGDEVRITDFTIVASAATFAGGKKTADAVTKGGIDVSTRTAADSAVTVIQTAIDNVSAERAKLGAMQNRLEHTIANLGTSAENLQAAESRIRDLDMAEEIMAFTKNNILQQAATAMLAQANMAPQSVLQLLG